MKRIFNIIVIAVIFTLALSKSSSAQFFGKYKNYSQHYHQSMRYGLFIPSDYDSKKSYSLIVYLHGSTDTVSRDNRYYQEEVQKKNPSFVITPKCLESDQGWGNTWHQGHTPATSKTLSLVDSLVKKYNIDRNRLYIYGISMGAFGVFSVLSKEQGKFTAGYAICGGSDIKAANSLLQTPLWIFHGEIDDVVPVRLSRDIYKEMIRLGGTKVKYTEYPGVKHNSWENALKEKDLNEWLFAQRKTSK